VFFNQRETTRRVFLKRFAEHEGKEKMELTPNVKNIETFNS